MNTTTRSEIYYTAQSIVMIGALVLLMLLVSMGIMTLMNHQKASAMYIIHQAPSNPLARHLYTNCLENKLKTKKYLNEVDVFECRKTENAIKPAEALNQLKNKH